MVKIFVVMEMRTSDVNKEDHEGKRKSIMMKISACDVTKIMGKEVLY